MNKSLKGALATGGAAIILLGGAGSLAYWTDDATANGGAVTSGFLTIDADGDTPCTTPVYTEDNASPGVVVTNFVPGDAITFDCTFIIGAEGDNLAATPKVTPEELAVTPTPAAASFAADVVASYTLDGVDYDLSDPITEDNDTDELVATIVVTFPYGDATTTNVNDTQNISAALDAITVTLTQDDPNA